MNRAAVRCVTTSRGLSSTEVGFQVEREERRGQEKCEEIMVKTFSHLLRTMVEVYEAW